jgi:glutathione S-transferase
MITIHAAYNYPPALAGILRDFRVVWAAEEAGFAYDLRWFDIMAGEQRGATNRAVNPFGKIPAMQDDDFRLFESAAIIAYFFDKAGRRRGDAQQEAKLVQWCSAALNTVEQPCAEIFQWDVLWRERPGRTERRAELVEIARTRLAELDGALGDRNWLVGEDLSAADILMATSIGFARSEPAVLDRAARVATWLQRCAARPAHARALAVLSRGPAKASAA